jgi:hypothetical protein
MAKYPRVADYQHGIYEFTKQFRIEDGWLAVTGRGQKLSFSDTKGHGKSSNNNL